MLVLTAEDHPPLHDPEMSRWLCVGNGGGLVAQDHAWLSGLLADPPDWLRRELTQYDPYGEALVIGTPYVSLPSFAGRPVLNHRRPGWVELENKTTIDALWDHLGAARAPAVVLDLDMDALVRASAVLDRGAGVVWSGDGPCINGGANYVRLVRTPEDAHRAFTALSHGCDQVRVMPFLEGVSVSVHGIVFPDGTAALRPIEMVVPRRRGTARFLYAGCASYYDPPGWIREQMRDLARRVGEHLRATVGYRGTFTLDGIATEEGFLPTEINTRYGGAMVCLEDSLPELPLALLQVALVAGHDVGVGAERFEETLLAAADLRRSGAIGANVRALRQEEPVQRGIVFDGWSCRWAEEPEPSHGTLRLRPYPVGGRLELELDGGALPLGAPVAPLTVAAFALADRDWGTGFGPLDPARETAREVASEAVATVEIA